MASLPPTPVPKLIGMDVLKPLVSEAIALESAIGEAAPWTAVGLSQTLAIPGSFCACILSPSLLKRMIK